MIIEPSLASLISAQPITINGSSSQVLTAGEGSSLVLLHGDGDTPATWQWTMPALARDHRVWAPSLPGHADVDKPPQENYTVASMTQFMRSYLDELGVDRCVLVGNSLGGLIAIRLALAQPDRFSALILVDSSGLGPEINPMIPPKVAAVGRGIGRFVGEMANRFRGTSNISHDADVLSLRSGSRELAGRATAGRNGSGLP
jgi:pimeloyl-ACP methyl ester carboxylesterase